MRYTIIRGDERGTPAAPIYITLFRIAVFTFLAVFIAVVLSGCAFLPLLAEPTDVTGGSELAAAPIVNSAIYSNDYVIDEGPVKGGAVRIYATHPDTFNPLLTHNIYTSVMFGLVYESLAGIGPGLTAEHKLAERWTVSVDGLIWHIVLREGIKWHDGRPLTAHDVVHTIDRIRSYGALSPYADTVSNIVSATAMSETEIRMILKKENAYAPLTWIFPIVPSHVMIDALDGLNGGSNLSAALIGTGPYCFRNYENGVRLVLTEADSWSGGAAGNIGACSASSASANVGSAGSASSASADSADSASADSADSGVGTTGANTIYPPYISDVSFIFYEPAVMALPLYRSRAIDMFFSRSFSYERYKASFEVRIRQYSERDFLFVAFNNASGMSAARSVRRALLRMTDRQRLIDEALGGRGMPAEFPVQPESSIYDAGIVSIPYDPQAARSILEGAGFRMDDGMFYGDVGYGWRKLSLTLLVNEQDSERCALADSLALMYAEHGVEIVVSREPADEVMQKVASGEYEMALLNYRTQLFPDMTELYSTPWQDGKEPVNPARYQNDEADRISHEIFTVYNELDRQTAFTQLAAIIQDDAPYLGICFQASVLVHGDDLKGDIFPSVWNPLNYFEQWYISDYK